MKAVEHLHDRLPLPTLGDRLVYIPPTGELTPNPIPTPGFNPHSYLENLRTQRLTALNERIMDLGHIVAGLPLGGGRGGDSENHRNGNGNGSHAAKATYTPELTNRFTELYQGYQDRIYNYIYYKTGHSVDAEDLTQQVFLKAYNALPGYRNDGTPIAAWLFTIARNAVIDHYRQRKSTESLSELPDFFKDTKTTPEEHAQKRDIVARLSEAVSELTEDQRDVIILRFIFGLDNEVISKAINKQEGAIRALQHRALLGLNRRLRDEKYGFADKFEGVA